MYLLWIPHSEFLLRGWGAHVVHTEDCVVVDVVFSYEVASSSASGCIHNGSSFGLKPCVLSYWFQLLSLFATLLPCLKVAARMLSVRQWSSPQCHISYQTVMRPSRLYAGMLNGLRDVRSNLGIVLLEGLPQLAGVSSVLAYLDVFWIKTPHGWRWQFLHCLYGINGMSTFSTNVSGYVNGGTVWHMCVVMETSKTSLPVMVVATHANVCQSVPSTRWVYWCYLQCWRSQLAYSNAYHHAAAGEPPSHVCPEVARWTGHHPRCCNVQEQDEEYHAWFRVARPYQWRCAPHTLTRLASRVCDVLLS